MAKRIAVVDDCPEFLPLLEELLGGDGYRVEAAYGQGRVLARLREARPDLLILDLVLAQGESGWDILADVRRDPALVATPVILCTADLFGIRVRAADLRRYRDVAVLAKPFHIAEMLGLVQRLIGPAGDAAGGEIAGVGSPHREAAQGSGLTRGPECRPLVRTSERGRLPRAPGSQARGGVDRPRTPSARATDLIPVAHSL